LDIFFYRFVMVVRKNVLEYIIALVVVKNKVRLKKCLKTFPPLGAIFLSPPPVTWNPGSAPDINLNTYIINVIADDESKIGLYEI
jgi:hypothetical protein